MIDPGETKTFQVKLTKPGVFPFYCTNFCSALHQEMQGYLVVQNEGTVMPASGTAQPGGNPPAPTTEATNGEPAVPAVAVPALPRTTPPSQQNTSPAPSP